MSKTSQTNISFVSLFHLEQFSSFVQVCASIEHARFTWIFFTTKNTDMRSSFQSGGDRCSMENLESSVYPSNICSWSVNLVCIYLLQYLSRLCFWVRAGPMWVSNGLYPTKCESPTGVQRRNLTQKKRSINLKRKPIHGQIFGIRLDNPCPARPVPLTSLNRNLTMRIDHRRPGLKVTVSYSTVFRPKFSLRE